MPESSHADAEARARKIKIMLYDVDGVLTDGVIWVAPLAPHGHEMGEMKGFFAHDGIGISLARMAGIQSGFITMRETEAVKKRARDLKLEHVYTGQRDKLEAVRTIMARTGTTLDQIAYAGDDIIDLPVMRVCGLAIAPANSRPEVLAAAHYVTPHAAGQGAGRDAVDFILRAQGIFEETCERYLKEHSPASSVK